MGVSASASVFVGFEVAHSDFWSTTTTTSKQPECPNGHPGPDGKFCQDCGKKIQIQKVTKPVPTSRFKAFVDAYNKTATYKPDYEEVFSPDPDMHPEEAVDRSAFRGLDYECVDAIDGGDHDKEHLAFGKKLLGVSDICGRSSGSDNSVGIDEIQKLVAEVVKVRDALGVDRPVKIYLTAYCSY